MRENEKQVIHRDMLDQNYFTFLVAYETVIPQFGALPAVRIPGYQRIMTVHIDDLQMFFGMIPDEIFNMHRGDTLEITMQLKEKDEI